MISDTLWHSRFGGDLAIVGQTVTLDAMPYTIIGVLPAGIQYSSRSLGLRMSGRRAISNSRL